MNEMHQARLLQLDAREQMRAEIEVRSFLPLMSV